ncbi:MAG TPA: 4-(cytidine 5'-diphospho)-2-C-methyl-D-erythritol kinase [Burkholderiales bacterium]|nr:4-(cytidine 5'-diphospho)-2-C-methyl-D-erythritol kinase [Burkholderiales bacterium]
MNWFPAPGKLNLFLHVLGRRADGYHELQTVFRLIDRTDRVGIAVRQDAAIRRHDPLPGVAEDDDLCVRAARLLQSRTRCPLGADLALDKRLPIGGGVGGGSSDAATTLIVLNRLWRTGLARPALQALALDLGADVPFFVFGRSALGEGVGERLSALELPPAWYLVLTPAAAVSTRAVFSDNALTRNTKPLKIPPFFAGQGANDLESVATRQSPEIARQLAWLRERQPAARMTGSGACVFAEFATEAQARKRHGELPEDMRGFVARGLERHPLYEYLES